jgi:hypothetical protein
MNPMYLYFDGIKRPIMSFDSKIMEQLYEWCRAMAMSFMIDGYCFRPYNQDAMNTGKYKIAHMDEWDHEVFTEICNSIP